MFARLVVLFITIPLVEVYLLLRLNEYTGSVLTTIGLIVLTGVVGAWLAKQQGLSTVTKIQQALSQGRLPTQELVDGGMILFAAALLVTPGILTDAFGFSLLFPPCRAVYRRLLKRWFPKPTIQFRQTTNWSAGMHPSKTNANHMHINPKNVVDGQARSIPDEQDTKDES